MGFKLRVDYSVALQEQRSFIEIELFVFCKVVMVKRCKVVVMMSNVQAYSTFSIWTKFGQKFGFSP